MFLGLFPFVVRRMYFRDRPRETGASQVLLDGVLSSNARNAGTRSRQAHTRRQRGPLRCTLYLVMSRLPLKFDAQGLVPVIVQDRVTGEIRMFAFATEAAVRKTLDTGRATFWSRSRGELWQKGRVSGHETTVVEVLADCDANCLIYSSDPESASCNSGAPSCFFQALDGERLMQASQRPQTTLASLEAALAAGAKPSGVGGHAKAYEKAGDFVRAVDNERDERVVSEAADTLYYLLVGLRSRSIGLRRVMVELARRLARSGLEPSTPYLDSARG